MWNMRWVQSEVEVEDDVSEILLSIQSSAEVLLKFRSSFITIIHSILTQQKMSHLRVLQPQASH